MPMDVEDQRYFTQQFGLVHKRITESEKAQTGELHRVTDDQNKKIAEIREAFVAQKAKSEAHRDGTVGVANEAARKAVEDHVRESRAHNPIKALGFLSVFFAVVGAIWGFAVWLFKFVFPSIGK